MKDIKNKKKLSPRVFIFDDREIDIAFSDFYETEAIRIISKTLNKRNLKISDTCKPYRLINSWSEAGLMTDARSNDRGWRQFNLVDVMWLDLVQILRDVGYSLETIKKVYITLFRRNDYSKVESPFFEIALISIFYSKIKASIEITKDGETSVVIGDKVILPLPDSSICVTKIDLNNYLAQLHNEKVSDWKNTVDRLHLDDLEKDIIRSVRAGVFSSINLIFNEKSKTGKIQTRMELTKDEAPTTSIKDILQRSDFQDIHIKKQDGKIVSVRSVVKKRK